MLINNQLACKIAKNLKHIKISRLIFKIKTVKKERMNHNSVMAHPHNLTIIS